MDALFPYLDVRGPDDEEFRVELSEDRLTIGRFREFNDVGLEPDPQHLVTRKAHCSVERDAEGWWVADNGSVNRTFLERGRAVEIVAGRTLLTDGDRIRILGRLTEEGEAVYWNLTFRDPLKTQPVAHEAAPAAAAARLRYDWIQAKLFLVSGATRREITDLRPQEHKLVRYMDNRNRMNGQAPVMCSYEELIEAVWGRDSAQTETEIIHLVWELRRKIEPDPKRPQFLQNVPRLGYRLTTEAAE
ncbi:MAG TPA: winged helix-turn-helix domain-containing protein [Pyrinomonadaceae bacterium]